MILCHDQNQFEIITGSGLNFGTEILCNLMTILNVFVVVLFLNFGHIHFCS